MATSTSLMIGLYFLILGAAFGFWWQFREMRRNFWNNRHIEIKDPVKPIDFTRCGTTMPYAGMKNGPRVKPKYSSDEKLFEIEQNPAKK